MAREKKVKAADAPVTTAQKLGALLKSARDIMRKDKGLNGDLDRLPLLTWLMFLKFLDDHEKTAETKAVLARKPYTPTIEAPYRWRDWGANDALTGDELLAFVSSEKVALPTAAGAAAKEGPGLIPYLRKLAGSNDPKRQVVGEVFAGVINRMESGFLLRQIAIKVNDLHFGSSEEIHTLGHLYESMLKEMRDAAGDSGEFYTPRAVVKFMVAATNPTLGEKVLDPACGTGGFLVEAFAHLERQAKQGKAEDIRTLQDGSIFGQEAKPLPYMLCQMNLLLHGLDAPDIDKGNSLEKKITDITDAERVDVILTNPPFGGEEEDAIKNNFPAERQTKETALLFLQLIMRKLKMPPTPGRAAVVVPNGTLFGDGVCARIKTDLLKNYNLHTIVRLPNGVFAPYTSIPTNILFFDRTGPTQGVWYYELPPPAGRKQYTKTAPLQFEEFADCLAWWNNRAENDRAWQVPASELLANGCNLDRQHPGLNRGVARKPPRVLLDMARQHQESFVADLSRLSELLAKVHSPAIATAPRRRLGDIAPLTRRPASVDSTFEYPQVSVRSFGRGTFHKPPLSGSDITWEKPHLVKAGDLLVSNIKAWEGAFAVAGPEDDGRYGSHRYLTFVADQTVIRTRFLYLYLLTAEGLRAVGEASPGSADRNRTLNVKLFTDIQVPIPPLDVQRQLETVWELISAAERRLHETAAELDAMLPSVLNRAFAGEL